MKKETKDATPFLPPEPSLSSLRKAAQGCRGCDLYKNATQAVFGEGKLSARLMLVGEKPGNQEDLEGHPFVGPSGHLLDRALAEAGIDRGTVYVTNAVKHFKWVRKGKIRLHQKPNTTEIRACRPWLESEVRLIHPLVLVCLGASAAYAVFGKAVRIGEFRGCFHTSPFCDHTWVTVHPSAVLRIEGERERHEAFAKLVTDLKQVARKLKELSSS